MWTLPPHEVFKAAALGIKYLQVGRLCASNSILKSGEYRTSSSSLNAEKSGGTWTRSKVFERR